MAEIPVPAGWTQIAKSGLVHAVALARLTLLQVLSGFENGRAPRARRLSERERLRARIAQLETEVAIKDRRMAQLVPAKRPHYSPPDRLEILLLMAATGWALAETARRFLVSPQTVANWKKRLDEQGEAALVRLAEPVNRFPDYVRALVRHLKRTVPSMGRQRLADTLAREGLCWPLRPSGGSAAPRNPMDVPKHSRNFGDGHDVPQRSCTTALCA